VVPLAILSSSTTKRKGALRSCPVTLFDEGVVENVAIHRFDCSIAHQRLHSSIHVVRTFDGDIQLVQWRVMRQLRGTMEA
jgi:hypothetical protein